MARLQILVLSCYPTVTVRGKALSLASVSWWLGFPGGTDNYKFDIDIPCGIPFRGSNPGSRHYSIA